MFLISVIKNLFKIHNSPPEEDPPLEEKFIFWIAPPNFFINQYLGHRPDTSGRCPQVDEISGLSMTRRNDRDCFAPPFC